MSGYYLERRRARRLDPALKVAEEIGALLAILGIIWLFGNVFAALIERVVR